jgi:hypothetical protein
MRIEMKVKDDVTKEIKTKTKNAFREATMFFRFEGIELS